MVFPCLAQESSVVEVTMPMKKMPECPAKFIRDAMLASDGSIWVVSEVEGVYRLGREGAYDGPWFKADYYANYPKTNNFYCIAEDKQGRIWVGTDIKGVSVFNGTEWQTYGRESALLGERVFDIAVSPTSGEVAIATSGGVTIYNPADETWKDFTRADGLVEDQVECLAFSPDGSLWLGYACGGVSKGSPQDGYGTWQTTQAPWYWDRRQRVRQPYQGRGKGLPSNLCNTITIGQSGTVWVGTVSGLGILHQDRDWRYVRGRNYNAKNNGVYEGRPKLSGGNIVVRDDLLLPSDFVTCIAESKRGLWIGTRDNGVALIDRKRGRVIEHFNGTERKDPMPEQWISSIIPFPDGSVCASTYGGGFILIKRGTGRWELQDERKTEMPKHPALPSAPDETMLAKGIKTIEQLNPAAPSSPALYWKDDWSTKGNWCGMYGVNYAVLCAANAPWNNEVYHFYDEYKVSGIMGAHRKKPDSLRHWVHWTNARNNHNVLYCPTDATRCEAEWDDHGETYLQNHDGPDLWAVVRVPEGRQMVSLYFYNPNGVSSNLKASGNAQRRDYLIEVRQYEPTIPMAHLLNEKINGKTRIEPFDGTIEDEMGKALSAKVLTRTRVNHFAGGGVYKNFMVQGPGVYFFRVSRNYSFNTILNGVFVQRIDKSHPNNRSANRGHIHFYQIYPAKPETPGNVEQESARKLLAGRETCPFNSPATLSAFEQNSLYLYRYARNRQEVKLADVMAWNLNLWTDEGHEGFDKTMLASWYNKQDRSPAYRSAGFMPNAPNVIPFSHFEVLAMDKMKVNWRQYLPGYRGKPDIPVEELRKKLSVELANVDQKMTFEKTRKSRKKR